MILLKGLKFDATLLCEEKKKSLSEGNLVRNVLKQFDYILSISMIR